MNPEGTAPPDGTGSLPPFRRLHPLSPLVRGVRIFAVLFAVISYQSVQLLRQGGSLVTITLIVAVALGMSWLSWLFTGYRVTSRELHVTEGVLARRHRAVPLERVQAVDVVRPVLARLLGLAELRLQVAGHGETAVPLAYLTVGEAEQLRVRLLGLVDELKTAEEPGEAHTEAQATLTGPQVPLGVAETPEESLFTLSFGRLVASQLLTPQILIAVIPVALTLSDLRNAVISGNRLAATMVIVAGLVVPPIRRLLQEGGFTLATAPEGLRIRQGLLDTRSQTVPVVRIQAVRIRRPFLWRPFNWVRVEIDVAGHQDGGSDQLRGGVLLPVADARTAHEVLHRVLPAVPVEGPDGLNLQPAPPPARWVAPLQYRNLAVGLTEELFLTRHGWLTVRNEIVPLARAQSIRLSQGPLQRLIGLVSVHVDTAGRRTAPVAWHRATTEGRALLEELVTRTQEARHRQRRGEQQATTVEQPAVQPWAGQRPPVSSP